MENTNNTTKKCIPADKKIQILLSTYNGEKYLREQLDSFLTLEGFESISVLVRDDGSTDSTLTILGEYQDEYAFQVIQGSNIGVNQSMFELFSQSDENCDYFALSDQDDVWLPNKFTQARKFLDDCQQDIPQLFASCSRVTSENLIPWGTTLIPTREIGFFNAMIQNICPGHTQVFNKALMKELKLCQPKEVFIIDHWIYLLASACGKVHFTSQCTVLHRQHGENSIGYELSKTKSFYNRVQRLIHAGTDPGAIQLKAFFERYGAQLNAVYYSEISRFFSFQTTFVNRCKYIRTTRAYRQTMLETFIFKILFILGKYRVKANKGE